MMQTETSLYTGSGTTVSLSAVGLSSPMSVAQRAVYLPGQQSGNYVTGSPAMGVQSAASPWIEILEQPKTADLRFRYKCEGRSAGSLLGEKSSTDRKSFPTIRINNFDGSNAIVVVSCVSVDKPYYVHPHNLVGNDCKDGVCTVRIKGTNVISFTNIGIQCVTKKDIKDSLAVRKQLQVNPFGTEPPTDHSKVDLTSIRLCFQAFLPDGNKKFSRIVPPVVSTPVFDKKVVHNLTICRLSKQSGYASGGEEIFLLCEKISRDDIQVRFFEQSTDGDVMWEAYGQFQPQDIHHQFAIVFQTPAYRDETINSPVSVFIQLRKPSDDSCSDPKPFQYIPVDNDPFRIAAKRKRLPDSTFDQLMNNIPIAAIPPRSTTTKEMNDDYSRSSDEYMSTLKENLKKKVTCRMQRQDGSSQSGQMAATATSTMPRYSYDDFGTTTTTTDGMQFANMAAADDASLDGSVSASVSTAAAAAATTTTTTTSPGAVIVTGTDGRLYAVITNGDGQHQIVEVTPDMLTTS